jgi:hypothetical protein
MTNEDFMNSSSVRHSSFVANRGISAVAASVSKHAQQCYNGTVSLSGNTVLGMGAKTNYTFTTEMVKNTASNKIFAVRYHTHTSMHDYKYPVMVVNMARQSATSTKVTVSHGKDILLDTVKKWSINNTAYCPEGYGIFYSLF